MSERNVIMQSSSDWLKMMGGRIKRHRSNLKSKMKRRVSKRERRAAVNEVRQQS